MIRDSKGRFVSEKNEKENKAMNRNKRNEALNNAGINTNGFFNVNVQVPVGATIEVKVDGKKIEIPFTETEIETLKESIADNGYVSNTKLWRRWITAQTFRMLNYKSWDGKRTGWNAAMNNHPYIYQFEMLLDELKAQQKILESGDATEYKMRNRFFNQDVVVALMKQYARQFKKYCKHARVRGRKGNEHIILAKYGKVHLEALPLYYKMFEDEAEKTGKMINPTPYQLNAKLKHFMSLMNKIPSDSPKCPEWKNAFKASGAYYSLRNMILFHDVLLDGCSSMYSSLKTLDMITEQYSGKNGWRLHEYLKKVIADNNFDLAKSIEAHK